ncbi:MAG: efflux RND transporter periplasmic adaptor subunit [Elusimicrobiales bacterium]
MIKNIAVILALAAACGCHKKQAGTEDKSVPVSVVKAAQKDVPIVLNATGTVEPIKTVKVMAQVDSRVTKIHIKDGQRLKQGDLIMELDAEPARQALAKAKAQLAQDMDSMAYSKVQAQRYNELVAKGAAAQADADQNDTAYKTDSAKVDADRAAVAQAQIDLDYTQIISPMDGKAGSLQVHEGDMTQKNSTTLIVVNQMSPIYVKFSVPEKYIQQVQTAKHAGTVPISAAPEGAQSAAGTLVFVDNAVNSDTGMIMLRGSFPNKREILWPGQFAAVTMTLGTEKGAVTLPSAAVMSSQDGKSVFVLNPNNTVSLRKVAVDRVYGDDCVITNGLAKGDTVVSDGQILLKDGAAVEIKTAVPQQ